jgi:TonB family protein
LKRWAILLACLLVSGARAQNPQPDSATEVDKSGPAPIHQEPTYKVGGDVVAPRVVDAPDPEYSEEARQAGLQGVCVVTLVVGSDGTTRDVRVDRSLGMGLDEKSIKAVRSWRFKPATKNGHAVAVLINVEVSFSMSGGELPEGLQPVPRDGNELSGQQDKHASDYPLVVEVQFVTGRLSAGGYVVTVEANIATEPQPRKLNATCGPKRGCLMLERGKYPGRWLSSRVIELRGRTENKNKWKSVKFSVADAP